MHMKGKIIIVLLSLLSVWGCSEGEPKKEDSSSDIGHEVVTEEEYKLEEAVPDSGMLEGVNPEEIITDDWSDEGEVELDTEQ